MAKQPQGRSYHAAFGVGSKHFLWGGDGSAVQTAQIETFDVSSAKWQEPLLLKGSPPGRLYGMAVTTDGDSAYSFGGYVGSTRTNSIYEINTRTLECRHVLPTSSYSPPGVAYGSILLCNEQLVACGGHTDKGRTNDLYIFDLRKGECGNSKLYSCLVSGARDEGLNRVRECYAHYSSASWLVSSTRPYFVNAHARPKGGGEELIRSGQTGQVFVE